MTNWAKKCFFITWHTSNTYILRDFKTCWIISDEAVYITCDFQKVKGFICKENYFFQFCFGAIYKRRLNILGGEGCLKFLCCKILEGRSWVNQCQNSDMEEGGRGYQKRPKKFRRLLWTAPNAQWQQILRLLILGALLFSLKMVLECRFESK